MLPSRVPLPAGGRTLSNMRVLSMGSPGPNQEKPEFPSSVGARKAPSAHRGPSGAGGWGWGGRTGGVAWGRGQVPAGLQVGLGPPNPEYLQAAGVDGIPGRLPSLLNPPGLPVAQTPSPSLPFTQTAERLGRGGGRREMQGAPRWAAAVWAPWHCPHSLPSPARPPRPAARWPALFRLPRHSPRPSLPPRTHGSEDTEPEPGRRPEAPGRLGRGSREPAAGQTQGLQRLALALRPPWPGPARSAHRPTALDAGRPEAGSAAHPRASGRAGLPLPVGAKAPGGGLRERRGPPTPGSVHVRLMESHPVASNLSGPEPPPPLNTCRETKTRPRRQAPAPLPKDASTGRLIQISRGHPRPPVSLH
ncbi:translation initiation factor IF-2-like isoform X2 [Prionailurus viverrinus]|uniref:translation initiation factor IF-2-like isoform X2 n=1 Tax=Prionailurus viverrinus TaxID=61388 RepID=UPI001FF2B127|nr:translation initiation factor IF-2-like isoform X2 [Prionailurus viverrinus]